MVEVKEEYPYIDDNGIKNYNMIKHYADGYKIKQNETGVIYDKAVDVFPCRYTYTVTDEEIIPEEEPEL